MADDANEVHAREGRGVFASLLVDVAAHANAHVRPQ